MKKTNSLLRGLTYLLCCLSISTFAQVFPGPGGGTFIDSNQCYDFTLSVNGVTEDLTEVAIDITHTWSGDLDISLIAPDGTIIDLSSDNGSGGDNYSGTIFSDDATTSITAGSAPFSGTYQPEQPLSTVAGQGDGDWTLRVCDDAGGDQGTLNAWSLRFGTPPPPPPPAPQDAYTSAVVDGSIPDNTCPTTTDFLLEVSGVSNGYLLAEVVIDIEHTWTGDLEISLVAPDGTTTVILSSDNGSFGNNYEDTSFRDDATTSITAGSAPFNGTYRPEEPLSAVGNQTDGSWYLKICDDAGGDTGALNYWSLIFEPGPPSIDIPQDCVTSYSDYCAELSVDILGGSEPLTILWSDGSTEDTITACVEENTVYSVTVTDVYGKTASDEVTVIYSPEGVTCQNDKVMVCHNKGNGTTGTLCISFDSLQDHLDHGDTIGSCEVDYYTCDSVPSCVTVTSPENMTQNVETPVEITWTAALGLVDGYHISIGTTPGGTDVVDNAEGGLDLSYTTDPLDFQTIYYITVIPYNDNGDAEGCDSSYFITQKDPCTDAQFISCDSSVSGSTVGNPVNYNIEDCGTNLNTAPGIWHRFTGTGDLVTVDTNGSSFDTKLGVFTGSCGELVCLDGDDDGGNSLQSLVTFLSEDGVEYLIYVTGFSSNAGNYTLNVACEEYSGPVEVTCGSPVNTTHCYSNNDGSIFQFTSADGSALQIVFNSGTIESCCDDILIYDGLTTADPLIYSGNNGGTLTGLTVGGLSDSLLLVIDSDGSISCADGSRTTWDFDVNCYTPPAQPGGTVTCGTTLNQEYCYGDSADVGILYTSSNGSPLTITFNSGKIEASTYDFLRIYDGVDTSGTLIYQNGAAYGFDLTGATATASSGSMFVHVTSDSSVSCASGSTFATSWSFDVSCGSARLAASTPLSSTIDWSMAPNPTKGNVTLDLTNYLQSNVNIEVVDFTGKVISTANVKEVQSARYTLELRNSLPAGMYFVRVAANGQVSTKKLMIMR